MKDPSPQSLYLIHGFRIMHFNDPHSLTHRVLVYFTVPDNCRIQQFDFRV